MENYKAAKLFDAGGDLGQRWFVFFHFRDPETNKFVRFREWISSRHLTRIRRYEAAREIIKRINVKLSQGWNPFAGDDPGLLTIIEAVDFVLQTKERSIRRRTYRSYLSHFNFFKAWSREKRLDKTAISLFNSNHAREFLDWYQQTRKISNRTYNNVLLSMNAIFNFLLKREYIEINPFGNIERHEIEEPSIIAFNAWERKVIRENLPLYNYDLYILSQLIFCCFLRPQELCRLKVENVDLVNGLITIPGSISKNRKTEPVAIPRKLISKMIEFDLLYPSHYFLFSKHLKRGEMEIFPQRITEAWNEFAGQYGIKKGIYAFKHTGNGLAVLNGINIRDLQLQNRHHDLKVTQKYFDRFSRNPSDRLINDFPEL